MRSKKETELRILVDRHAAELRQIEAQLIDQQTQVNKRIESILGELKEVFSNRK